ncbi:MAG: right-handed parallel beta-helix repeat-containing protein [Methylacidiphilales bacterium]|nr:right-handed parallel beta-helix repeat-containing protein [Candidatus Methylacidiphilales bacterium]MDW8348694.1 right-handed parallel beta-helix repeat-containing protein [Verrucomicrobiae bacterium]
MNDDLLYGQTVAQFRANLVLLDRFQLHGILGRSPISLNWLATEKRPQRFVALKFIPEPIRRFPEHLEDLDKACRLVRPLKHEHIASVYEFIVTHDWAAFSVEAIDGETLAEIVVKEPYGVFDIAKLSSYITEVCSALHYAHSQNVIHDDIKPSNIMRSAADGHIKVTDFHISRAVNNAAANVVRRLTPPESLPTNDFILRHGTAEALKFMSPQRAYGMEPTPQDDIYSLGATIYYLLTGSLPYRQEHILNPIEATTPPKMSLKLRENGIRNRFIPPSWDSTIAACLDRRSQNRPQSILEFAHALDLDIGIPYSPFEQKKSQEQKPVDVAEIKSEAPHTHPSPQRFPSPSSSSSQPFFTTPPPGPSSIPNIPNIPPPSHAVHSSEATPIYPTFAGGSHPTAKVTPHPDSDSNIKPSPDTSPDFPKQATQQAPTPSPPPATASSVTSTTTATKPTSAETYSSPNFSRGPRTTSTPSTPQNSPPIYPTKTDPFAATPEAAPAYQQSSTQSVSSAHGAAPSSHTPPPRPASYTSPSHNTSSYPETDTVHSAPYSSPFRDDTEDLKTSPSSTSAHTEYAAWDSAASSQTSTDPLPYEEIDEKEYLSSSAQSRKHSTQRSDPTHQRSRFAQRSRTYTQQPPPNFNPPPPYAYQQKTEPPPPQPSKKKSNWQKNLITILIAVLAFYASLFVIGFILIQLDILPKAYLEKFTFLFSKNKAASELAITPPSSAPETPSPTPEPPHTPPPQSTQYTPTELPQPPATDFPHSAPPAPPSLPTANVTDQPASSLETPQIPTIPSQSQTVPSPTQTPAPAPVSSASPPAIHTPAKTVPDEYIQIQAAIDAASPGETIRIKPGTYTENLILREGIRIIGDGMDVVTIQCPPTSPVLDIRNIQTGHIEGVTLTHTERINPENSPPLVHISNSNVEITRCRIINSSGSGIQISNGSRATLRQNIIENNSLFGISVMDSGTAPIIERNQINNNQRVGLVFSSGASGTATGNIVKGNLWDGIAVLNPTTAPTIQQNISIENQRRGIFFAKGAGGIADGNTSEKNKMNGISILDEGTAPTISNNRVSNNELRGIHFGKGAKGVARGNICENNGDIGILIVDEGTRPELHNNTARNNEGWGIAIAQGAEPPPSSGNIARDNKQGQINFEQTR